MVTQEDIELAKEYAKPARDGRGKPGWFEGRDPALKVAPHHQEAATYGQSSHVRGEKSQNNAAPVRQPDPRWAKGGRGGYSSETGIGMTVLDAEVPTKMGSLRVALMKDLGAYHKQDIDAETEKEILKRMDVFIENADGVFDRSIKAANRLDAKANIEPEMERVWKDLDKVNKEDGKRVKEEWDKHLDKRETSAKSRNDKAELERIDQQREALQKSYTRWYGRK